MVSQTKVFVVASCFLKVTVLLLQLCAYDLQETAAVSRNLSVMSQTYILRDGQVSLEEPGKLEDILTYLSPCDDLQLSKLAG